MPGAGTGPGQGTLIAAINPVGVITGGYLDANFAFHGFGLDQDGTITNFDPPGAGTGPGQGTLPISITPAGEITGFYIDSNFVNHGFVRK